MSAIRIYNNTDKSNLLFSSTNNVSIRSKLADIGVRFEQWLTNADVQLGASTEDVLRAYKKDIDALVAQENFKAVDVISVTKQHPNKVELRQQFLQEYHNNDDEIRFIVAGEGLYTLHVNNKIYEVLCTKGDLIKIPARMPHWFDMGPNPSFIVIRFFNNPNGWAGELTGNLIAERFNRLDN